MDSRETALSIIRLVLSIFALEEQIAAVYYRLTPTSHQLVLVTKRCHTILRMVIGHVTFFAEYISQWARSAFEDTGIPIGVEREIWEPHPKWHRLEVGAFIEDSPFTQDASWLESLPDELPGGWQRLNPPPRLLKLR